MSRPLEDFGHGCEHEVEEFDFPGALSLEGRAFIVAGAGAGIGRHSAHALAQAGADVVCVDRDGKLASAVAAEVGGTAFAVDVTSRSAVESLRDKVIGAHGQFHGVVDIVGMATFVPFLQLTDENWETDFQGCLYHAFLCAQVLGQHLVEHGRGSLVFVSSLDGERSAPRHVAYGAAKAGLNNMIRSLATEFGAHGVRVNGIAPGPILTPRIRTGLSSGQKARLVGETPLGRMGETSDVASAALYLSSDLSSFVTGQILAVDGGASVSYPYTLPEQSGQLGAPDD